MLKEHLESKLAAVEDAYLKGLDIIKKLEAEVKSYQDDAIKHIKLKRHVDNALRSIETIKSVNCQSENHWQRYGGEIIEQAKREGEDKPEWPESSKLYVAINHLEDILNRSVEEVAEQYFSNFR